MFPLVVLFAATLLGGGGGYLTNTAISYLVALPADAKVQAPPGVPLADGATNPAGKAPTRPVAATGPSRQDYLETLLCRNLVDPEKVGQCSFNEPDDGVSEAEREAKSELNATLIGTLVASPAQYSSALILEEGSERAEGYSIDDVIQGRTIIAIEKKLIRLQNGERVEVLRMEEDGEDNRPTRAASTSGDDESADGVSQIDENTWAVPEELLNKHLNDLEGLSRMGRALLHRGPDGEFDGYRLSAIRRNTIADQLGIKNGDIIHSVNGKPLNSMQAAMEAYNTMQNEKEFSFTVTRRGQEQTLNYQVQ
jgi:general secretion pathway protein C